MNTQDTKRIPFYDLFRMVGGDISNSDRQEFANDMGPRLHGAIADSLANIKNAISVHLVELAVYCTDTENKRKFVSLFSANDDKFLEQYRDEVRIQVGGNAPNRKPLVIDPRFHNKPLYINLSGITPSILDDNRVKHFSLSLYHSLDQLGEDINPEMSFNAFSNAVFKHLGIDFDRSRKSAVLAIPFPRANTAALNLSDAKDGGVLFVVATAQEGANWHEIAYYLLHDIFKMVCMEIETRLKKIDPLQIHQSFSKVLWSNERAEWFSDSTANLVLHDLGVDTSTTNYTANTLWAFLEQLYATSNSGFLQIPKEWGPKEKGLTDHKVMEALKHLVGNAANCQMEQNDKETPEGGGKMPTLDSIALLAMAILNIRPECAKNAFHQGKGQSPPLFNRHLPKNNARQAVDSLILAFSLLSRPHRSEQMKAGTTGTVKQCVVKELSQSNNALVLRLNCIDPMPLIEKFNPAGKTPGNLSDAFHAFERLSSFFESIDDTFNHPRHTQIKPRNGRHVGCCVNIYDDKTESDECVISIVIVK